MATESDGLVSAFLKNSAGMSVSIFKCMMSKLEGVAILAGFLGVVSRKNEWSF